MGKYIIAGNWKMNKTPSEAQSLLNEMIPMVNSATCEVVVCVPFIDIGTANTLLSGTNIKLGAQNMHFAESGAYTGEISGKMLTESGVSYVIIGHSERREYFAETDETVNKKIKAALSCGLKVILCVGETLKQREDGITEQFVVSQVKNALDGITDLSDIVIAYEPIWAIGTGKTATSAQADEVCGIIRKTIASLYDDVAAKDISILYGGSMNASNAAELLSMENVDGGLIGGASLKANDFSVIVNAACK